uniref:NADH dehydrogenase [ubiquinone] 1 beta subcomplex subunit 3 n=1 Tax=Bracon brevicornis TaxID=1563983 RepID=A0A6V7M6C2_9HYME
MGGHDHHHHGPPYKVPSASIYKLEDAPPLMELQKKLAKKGLRDPWLRNHVWKYQKKFGTVYSRLFWMLMRGVPTGAVAFGLTLAVENALGIDYHPWHHHHDDAHGDEHH